MPNWAFPAFPPYVANGWFLMPTFPSRWWHPVLGSKMVADANAFALLDRSWSPTPGLADMRRTESEAETVIHHDIYLSLAALTGATPGGTPALVNRRSASWQEVIDRGWQTTPLAAAKAPIGGPAPVTEGRAPGVTQPPGGGAPLQTQARSEQIPPTAVATAAAISAGVPSGDPEAEKKRQQEDQKAMSQTPQQPGQPGHPPGQQPPQPGQPGHPNQHPPQPPGQPTHPPGQQPPSQPSHEPPHQPGTGGGRHK